MAITVAEGQSITQAELDALVAQHGGMPSGSPPSRRSRTEAEIKAAALAGDTDPAAQQRPIYRYVLADGSYVDARDSADGERSEIVGYKPTATFTQAQAKAAAAAPENQTPQQQNEAILNQQRAKNAALPGPNPQGATEEERRGQDPRYETDQERAARADATIKAQGAAAETARKEAEATAEKNKPQVVPGTLNTTSPQYATIGPDGTPVWRPNPNYQQPTPKPITIPGNPRTIIWDNGDGTTRTEKNPDYVKPSKIQPHPSDPTKMVNITEDDAGNPVILPVNDQTVIKPADLPVLQTKFGQIGQDLGKLAQELNARFARGEITEKQKNEAFTAAHQQAQTQVSEINSILENSRAIWSSQVTQRGQSLAETQSRRAYASGIFGDAAQTGMTIAQSSGPGHGAAIASGVGALMNIGQRYAEGMGGFRESPEVPLPAALQQARGIGIPGYPLPGSATAADPAGAAAAAAAQAVPGGAGGPNAIGVGGSGAVPAPGGPAAASGLPPPIFRPQPPVSGPVGTPQAATPGMNPMLASMQQQLQGAAGFGTDPVAAGGLGTAGYDPSQEIARMIGDGSDPDWALAVQQAAQQSSQPGYAWQRFTQPATRFG